MERKPRRSGWILPAVLLAVYLFIKLQAWEYGRQVRELEHELDGLRPALNARVLSEQLEKTRQACGQINAQVRRMDLQNGKLLDLLSKLPASFTLERVEDRVQVKSPLQELFSRPAQGADLRLRTSLKIQGVLRAGVRDPESVLVRWAQSLQLAGLDAAIGRLSPSPQDPALWSFEVHLKEP